MKSSALIIIFFSLVNYACGTLEGASDQRKHVFYLHGRIIEMQGKNAVSEVFGTYEFDSIVAALNGENTVVHAEVRATDVDTREYALHMVKQIDSLIENGVVATNITVIGASKGAIIAAHLSSFCIHPINYVFIAGNNDYQEANNDWKFHGQVLCIYDPSDEIAGKDYSYWNNKEQLTTKFEQLALNTNLGHGFLYKPLDVWVVPVRNWINDQQL